MKIERLQLNKYRNYESESLEFFDGVNMLVGKNAQGKTNIVEAVFYLCTGYSSRVAKEKQLIKEGEEKAKITGFARSKYGAIKVEIEFNKFDKKTVRINDVSTLKIGELMENMYAVLFNPNELKLVKESPEDRRRFMNISLCQMYKSYFYALNRYNKILEQRNALLKNPNADEVRKTLCIWDEQLSAQAAIIIDKRNKYIEQLTPYANEVHKLLSGGEDLKISGENGYFGTVDEIKTQVYYALQHATEKDVRFGYTTIGPHRDDLKITLNGMDVRIYGSQGQQRTAALSIKIAETEIFKEKFGEYPILILDDVFSELDRERKKALIKAVSKMQTLITSTTDERALFKSLPYKRIVIENGAVKSQKTQNLQI